MVSKYLYRVTIMICSDYPHVDSRCPKTIVKVG